MTDIMQDEPMSPGLIDSGDGTNGSVGRADTCMRSVPCGALDLRD